jgi:protein tyrosine/serine phosphatase
MLITPETTPRHLDWPHSYNTRDLGGLGTEDGKETRWQAVIRSDIVNRLTKKGREALIAYGVRTVIDLRSPQEAADEPSVFAKASIPSLTYFNLPLEKYYPHVSALIDQAKTRGEVYCIVLDHHPDAVATVMRAIIQASPGGVVVHCHAGKDRTGIIAALLLRLVGVSVEMVAADYAESQIRLWPLYEKIIEEAGREDKVSFWLKPTVTEETMYIMLEHLDSKYGGVESYLFASGLTIEEIGLLRQHLYPTGNRC